MQRRFLVVLAALAILPAGASEGDVMFSQAHKAVLEADDGSVVPGRYVVIMSEEPLVAVIGLDRRNGYGRVQLVWPLSGSVPGRGIPHG